MPVLFTTFLFFFFFFYNQISKSISFIRYQESYFLYGSLLEDHYATKNTNQKHKNINNRLKIQKKRTHNRVIVI